MIPCPRCEQNAMLREDCGIPAALLAPHNGNCGSVVTPRDPRRINRGRPRKSSTGNLAG